MLKGIDHVGYRCSEPRKVVEFYTKVLGAEFIRAVSASKVSTGEDIPHINIFLRLEDGSMLDFVDSPYFKPAVHDPNTPSWVKHIAMRVDSEDDLFEIKRRVEASGLQVDGPVARPRNIGIYFFDPFGNRLEVTYERIPQTEKDKAQAYEILDKWEHDKAQGRL